MISNLYILQSPPSSPFLLLKTLRSAPACLPDSNYCARLPFDGISHRQFLYDYAYSTQFNQMYMLMV